jgi:hypothetical protein
MTESPSPASSHSPEIPADSTKDTALNPAPSLKDLFIPFTRDSATSINSSPSNQKIEVVFAQGHRLCLHGPFDWEKLSSWLTPLLTKQDQE